MRRRASQSSQSSSHYGEPILQPALHSASSIGGPQSTRSISPSLHTSHDSLTGSDAFVKSKRNSMISLASRTHENDHGLPHSAGAANGLFKLASKTDGDRSLEEGEIIEETPPDGIERVYSRETWHGLSSAKHLPRQASQEQRYRHQRQRESDGGPQYDGGSQYAARASRYLASTAAQTTEETIARSTTPSPLYGVREPLVKHDNDADDMRSSYSAHRIPHSAARSDRSRPSTATSSTAEEQRNSRHSTNGKRGEHEDDISRTPRRTPFHRKYDPQARSAANQPYPSDLAAAFPERDALDNRRSLSATNSRPSSSLARHPPDPSDQPARLRTSQNNRTSSYVHQDRERRTTDRHDASESSSIIADERREGERPAFPTQSNRTSQISAISSGEQGFVRNNGRPYSRAAVDYHRQHERLDMVRMTPRSGERPPSRSGQSSSAMSSSRSVRSISDQPEPSDRISYGARARRRTISDREGQDRAPSRPASQADGEFDFHASLSARRC